MIQIENLHVEYGDQLALSIDHLSIKEKENICLIGKSGSGKTTLLECMFGLRNYTGKIHVPIKDIAFAPQKVDLIPNFTVKTNVLMGRFGNISVIKNLITIVKENHKVDDILDKLNILDQKTKYVKNLSGGERQRVLVARTIYENKPINLLDEPTSALDAYNSQNTISYLIGTKSSEVVICSIHDLSLIDFFDRVIILNQGKIILDEKVRDVKIERLREYFDE